MKSRDPVLLLIVIDTSELRWYAAGVGLDGTVYPLLASEPGNLEPYRQAIGDEQLSFLRHRLSGILQQASDRLWSRNLKPCRIVTVLDGEFSDTDTSLARRLAEHMHQWLWDPPADFYLHPNWQRVQSVADLQCLAGGLDPQYESAFLEALPLLAAAIRQAEKWEVVHNKRRSH